MSRIHIQAAMTVELYDQFTGRPIKDGQAYITALPEQKIIHKESGCYVFLYPFVQGQTITVHSQIFEEQQIVVEQCVEDSFFRQIIWLVPDVKYNYPMDATYIYGKTTGQGSEKILVYLEKEKRPVRLAEEYEKGSNQISLYGCRDEMRNTEYALCSNKEAACSLIHITQADDSGRCTLLESIPVSYKKTEAILHKVYHAVSKKDGTFFLAIPDVPEDTTAHIKIGDTYRTTQIKAGEKNEFIQM